MFEVNKLHLEDCIEGMKQLPENSFDIAIADPPYNLSKGNKWAWDNSVKLPGMGGNWSKLMEDWDNISLNDYVFFTEAWIVEVARLIRPTGSFWIHGTYHNIGIINYLLQKNSIEIINEVVWYKRNSFPNLSNRRLTASHETILWCHTGTKKRDYYFDAEYAKHGKFDEDNLKNPGKQMRTVWDIPNNKAREELSFGKHPSQKPIRLLERMLKLSSKKGQLLLVPFAGSGSECLAAKNCGLNYVGFEVKEEYYSIAQKRLLSESNSANDVITKNSNKIQLKLM